MNRHTILYVEDDEVVRRLFTLFLARHAGRVLTANDGLAGWGLYQREKPDMVFTDVLMPVMNGLEMAARIKVADRLCPIVFLTATPECVTGFAPFDPRIDHVLEKPVHFAELTRILRRSDLPVAISSAG